MADEIISTQIVANADFSSLIADVHKITASLSKLQQQLASSNKMLANNVAVINRNFADTLRSTGQFSSHFVSLTSDVEKFGKNLDTGRLKLKDYFNTYQGHLKTSGGLIRELARQQVAMQNSILQPLGRNAQGLMQFNVHVPRGLDEIKNKTALARQELAIMNKVIQDGSVQLINWGKNTQWAGRQLTVGLTLPLAAFGKAAADAFKVADQELTRLTKVYGDIAGTSTQELGRVRREVIATSKELSAAYGTNFSETISLAADIAATGKQGQELLDSVKETSRLAVLGEVDRQEAMKATLAIQSAFKSNTEELANSINFLNAVENQTSTTLQDLVEAIPKAGPVIKGLGGSVQDLALYLTAMREGGISASEGANALKSALASLINPTDKAVEKFQSFGIDLLGIVSKNAGDVTGTLLELQASLDRLNPLQKQQAIEQLFGKFQFSRLNALFENLGRQGSQTLQVLDLMKASTTDLASIAGRELTAVTESASGKYKRALESLKADLAGVGEQFLTIGTKIITIVDKALDFFNGLPKPIKQALTFIGALTAVAGPLIMLTGVLANFFGYILKGVMHMKAFFKGGEGWKYLTPEMLAAEKAGKLVEQTFYSDAKAASILQLALKNLIDEFSILEAKAKSGAVSVNPAVSTMAGNLIMGAGSRVVNPQHPLAGAMGTRASTHMVPRSSLTEEQRMNQTIFGLVPGAIPVNRKIGDAPQIYMNEPLPPVPGLTTIGGASTGVVAGEAARWHAMMGTLAMQSKAEIDALKKQIATTGVVSKDFMNQFDDILPVVSGITDNAAKQSALIVAELRAGKINVEQARAQIIALNLEIERMITQAVGQQAATMGRTINPTMVPTLNQPVVDPTGKSNMRELFKKSKTRDLIDKISRSLGVRTSGAGYNIETTKPKKFNMGGPVYLQGGGGPKGTDTIPAWLSPGEYVLPKHAVDRIGIDTLEAARQGATLKIAQGSPIVGAHASMPMALAGHELMSGSMAEHAPESVKTFATHYPDEIFDIKDSQRLGLFREENDALREGKMGLTKYDLARALSAPESQLFRHMPNLTAKEKRLLRINMLNRVRELDGGGIRYHDSTLAKIFGFAKVDTYKSLTDEEKLAFRKKFFELQKPKYIQQRSLSHLVSAGSSKMSTSEAKTAAGNQPFSFKQASGKSSKDAMVLPGENNKQYVFTSGATRQFKKSIASSSKIGAINPRRVVTSLAQVMMRNRWKRGFADGGVVPNSSPMYLENGGEAKANAGMGTAFAGMGLMSAGSMIGGNAGQAMSFAGMAMQMAPLLSFLPKIPVALTRTLGPFARMAGAVTKVADGFKGLSKVFNLVLRPLSMVLRAINPVTAGLTLLAIGVKLYIDHQKKLEEQHRITRLGFGMNADAAKKAGYNYTDYNKKVKDSIANLKAVAERNKMIYESMTQAGVPFKMTIEQYKKLKETVKSTMGDYVKLFDSTKVKDIGQVAIQLKAQFMAAGDTVEEATAKIYTLISMSNKASMAGSTIGSTAFKGIKTVQDAAEATIKTFNAAASVSDAKGQVDALLSAFTALDAATTESVKQSRTNAKDASTATKTEYEAAADVVEEINRKLGIQKNLTADMIKELAKTNPELAQILTTSDTVVSAFQKLKLLSSGINLNVSQLNSAGVAAAAQIVSAVQAAVRNNSVIKTQSALYKTLKDQITATEKAQKGMSAKQQIDSKNTIKGLQKQIDLIKEQAKTKIDAIRKQTEAQNAELEIQKEQLAASQALVSGDMSSYAQSQLNIQQLVNTQQQKAAEEAITAKAELDIKPLQDQINALQDANEKLSDAAAIAGDRLTVLQKRAATLNDNLNTYTTNLDNLAFKVKTLGESFKGSQEYKDAMKALEDAGKKLGITSDPSKVLDDIVKSLGNISADTVSVYLNNGGLLASYGQGTGSKSAPIIVTNDDINSDSKSLSFADKKDIIKKYGLKRGQYFQAGETLYEVDWGIDNKGLNYKGRSANPVKRAGGGRFVPGIPYSLNDDGKTEGITFDMPGRVYPNINTMPRYNIPTNTISGLNNHHNSSYNNNVYNIDIALNGTNVTVDDVMRRFKAELALVQAKEGKVRKAGGIY